MSSLEVQANRLLMLMDWRTAKAAALLVVSLFCSSHLAHGQELVSGWEGGPAYGYAFVSPVFSVPPLARNTFVIRPTISYLYYNFQEEGGLTTVHSPGVSLVLGYRRQTRRLVFTLGPGVELRRDDRLFTDGQRVASTQVGAIFQGEAFFQVTGLTNLNLVSSYEMADRYVWSRAGFKRQVTRTHEEANNGLAIGAEVNAQGNQDVYQCELGGLIEIPIPLLHISSLQLRGGYAHLWFADGSTNNRPYIGIGFYHHF